MSFPHDCWASYEATITSSAEFFEAVQKISAYQKATVSRFVWRGAVNADWGLHSSLVRSYGARHAGTFPMERDLRAYEQAVLAEAREWGLDWHTAGGRLTALELLAALQHYGVPTRLLDFTFNPFIALWFAVEKEDGTAGRVIATDIADQAVGREAASSAEPWWLSTDPSTTSEWSTRPWIWRPPPFEPRIVRQDGCFLMGGVPSTQPARNVRDAGAWRLLHADEVRSSMSVPVVLINYDQAEAAYAGTTLAGQPPKARTFTLRIEVDKEQTRAELDRMLGHRHPSLFPDFPGLAEYGTSFR